MAVVSRVTTLVHSGATGSHTFVATATVQDTGAGLSVDVTVTFTAAGVTPPANPETFHLDLFIDNTANIVRQFVLNPASASQVVSFFFTSNGQSGGSARCGTIRMRLRAARTNVPTYDVNSDVGGDTPQVGFSVTQEDQGWIRGTTTGAHVLSNVSQGGATPNPFAARDPLFHRLTLGAQPFQSQSITLKVGAIKSASVTDTDTTFETTYSSGDVDNAFPASSASYALSTTVPNAALATGQPWTVLTESGGPVTVDPRITFTQLLQVDNSSFAADPMSLNVVSGQRLTSQLGFLAARARNARSEGLNGIAWNEKLWDTGNLTGSEASPVASRAVTSQNQGAPAQAGWADGFLVWDESLPGGSWTQKEVLTTADLTGLEVSNTRSLTLLAVDPNKRVIVSASPSTSGAEADHWHAGDPLYVTAELVDLTLLQQVAVDVATGFKVLVVRHNPSTRRAEYLTSAFAWATFNGATADTHAMAVSPNDSKLYELTFSGAQTTSFGDIDLIAVIAFAFLNGTPYAGGAPREAVGKANGHAGYAIDALQLGLGGGLGTR